MWQVDALLALLRGAVARGMDWGELQALVDESAKHGDGLAEMVHALHLPHHVTIVLSHPDEDDDAGEELLTAPAVAIKLDLRLSAAANARNFYTAKKARHAEPCCAMRCAMLCCAVR